MAFTFDILLDGITIKNVIDSAEIRYDESSVHNFISINSADKDLFWRSNPAIREGTSRIEVQVGSRTIYFLLEAKEGGELSFSLWGRSLSAREENPYSTDLDYELGVSKSAETVANELLQVSSLDWQCDDWNLPSSFRFYGSPMQGVQMIASAIGAVVRCKDDGTIYVRQKFPVRPIDMANGEVAVNYSRKNLIRLSYEETKGTGYNQIDVVGNTSDVNLPSMEVEEASPITGSDVHIRVYWAGKKPTEESEQYVTNGSSEFLSDDIGEEVEVVVFENGVGSVTKSALSITEVSWIGDYGGAVTHVAHSKDLEIGEAAYRIAEITYQTEYSRYRLKDHNVEKLIFLLTFGGESDVSVSVSMGDGDVPAPELNQSFLTTQNIAVIAGSAWLDNNRYNQKRAIIEAPYNDNAIDGVLVYINDAEIDCLGKFHVLGCGIIFDGIRILNQAEVLQCQV